MSTKYIGDVGEDFAASAIEKLGMRVVTRKFRSRRGEIDIIANDGEYICFVEVKTRKNGNMVSGEMAVNIRKQRKIIITALTYLQKHKIELAPRFDVISVHTDKTGEIIGYDYLKGAFDGSAYSAYI